MFLIRRIAKAIARQLLSGENLLGQKLNSIHREIRKVAMSQEEFNQKIEKANIALDGITETIKSEAQQIKDFIAAHPEVDTSGLDGVVSRLEGVSSSVGSIFEPAAGSTGGEVTEGSSVGGTTAPDSGTAADPFSSTVGGSEGQPSLPSEGQPSTGGGENGG